jgi:hypothetical protein
MSEIEQPVPISPAQKWQPGQQNQGVCDELKTANVCQTYVNGSNPARFSDPDVLEVTVTNYLAALAKLRADGRLIEAVQVVRGGYCLRLRPLRVEQPEIANPNSFAREREALAKLKQ